MTLSCIAAEHNVSPDKPPIIELTTLKTLLAQHAPHLILVDVRRQALYETGHIPGATNFPVEWSFNQKGDNSRIASLQQIRSELSRTGIHNDDYIVLYDTGNLKNAAHVYWVLATYGQKQLSVLDGGLDGWTAAHGKLSTRIVALPHSDYSPTIATHLLSTELATLLATHNPNVTIIDARSRQEYLGLKSRSKRKGHIPTAISIPWSENLRPDSKVPLIKSKAALHVLYHMLDKDKPVIAYCNRGKESSVTFLVLRELGYHVSIYDGAWLEWGNNDQLPIAVGPRPGKIRNGE